MTNLAEMMRLWIAVEGLEQKGIAEDIGIEEWTLTRLLNGKQVSAENALKIMYWLIK
jgi:plasmid maintenance system antidote protein VapI